MSPYPDPLPISALQHLIFCERQCALIHLEGLWAENRLTVEGQHLHKRAHGETAGPRGGGRAESRDGVRTVRALALCSDELGLVGNADVVEFHAPPTGPEPRPGPSSQPIQSLEVPFPVEYKRGRPKSHDADKVQLCAQALCLEEMLATSVPRGAIFYGQTRRRLDVEFDAALRALTRQAALRLHALIAGGRTPRAQREKKCDRCSLLNLCLPDATGPSRSASRYLDAALAASVPAQDPPP